MKSYKIIKKIGLQFYQLKLFMKLQIYNIFHVLYLYNHYKIKNIDNKTHHFIHKIIENKRKYHVHKIINSQRQDYKLQYKIY